MKTSVLIISVVLFMVFTACGQSGKDVPQVVASAFSQKFPKATKVEWGKENETVWEAEFKMDGKEYSANFENTGKWVETEYEITAKEIPAAVKSTLDAELNGFKIEESSVSETAEGKVFEFKISKGKEEADLSIDVNGNVIKKEQVKEEDEEEGE
jgi:hypothetical protein